MASPSTPAATRRYRWRRAAPVRTRCMASGRSWTRAASRSRSCLSSDIGSLLEESLEHGAGPGDPDANGDRLDPEDLTGLDVGQLEPLGEDQRRPLTLGQPGQRPADRVALIGGVDGVALRRPAEAAAGHGEPAQPAAVGVEG